MLNMKIMLNHVKHASNLLKHITNAVEHVHNISLTLFIDLFLSKIFKLQAFQWYFRQLSGKALLLYFTITCISSHLIYLFTHE